MTISKPCEVCLREAKALRNVVRIARPAIYEIKMNSGERRYLCAEHFEEFMRPATETIH